MPAAAVRPQEGWYVRGTMTSDVSGVEREYFIIDNKMSADPWYVNMKGSGYRINLTDSPIFSLPFYDDETARYYRADLVGHLQSYYQGFSDSEWVVDEDWLLLLDVDGITMNAITKYVRLYVFDKSKQPVFYLSPDEDAKLGVIQSTDAIVGVTSTSGSALYGNGYRLTDGQHVLKLSSTVFDVYQMIFAGSVTSLVYSSVDGTSINDLCVCILPEVTAPDVTATFGAYAGSCTARVAVSWAIPVDKAPAGTQVGDSWPKQRPIEVQMEDAYSAWMDSALQNTPYGDASNVGTGIQGYNQQLEESDNWGTLATEGWQGIAPIFDSFDFVFTILAIVGVTFILLLLIKKGMA